MASYFTLTLDTAAPTGCSISILSPASSRNVTATLAATGAAQMKLYGDIVASTSSGAAITEAAATWETYSISKALTLTASDGAKTVYAKFRDAVGNESAAVSTVVSLDCSAPTVTVNGPDVSTVSLVQGYDSCTFSFTASEKFVEYQVRVVPANNSAHTAGTLIGTAHGSANMSGTGNWTETSSLSCTIRGADLAAAASGDGAKIIKVFVRDQSGNWSV